MQGKPLLHTSWRSAPARPLAGGGGPWPVGLLVLSLLFARPPIGRAQGAQVACESWTILGTDSKTTQRVQKARSQLLRDVPKLVALVEKLNAAQAADAKNAAAVQQFARVLSQTSRELPPALVTKLASSLAEKLSEGAQQSNAQLIRELERLRLDMEELQDKLNTSQAKKEVGQQVSGAVQGDAAEAISRLDFQRATDILSRLEQHILNDPISIHALSAADAEKLKQLSAGGMSSTLIIEEALTQLRHLGRSQWRGGSSTIPGAFQRRNVLARAR